jgi:hypothetical protein
MPDYRARIRAGIVSLVVLTFFIVGVTQSATQAPNTVDPPKLPIDVYYRILSECQPPWDAKDTNVIAVNGQQLGYQPNDVQSAFLEVWGDKAWQRWRWEYNCLLRAFTEPYVPPTTPVTTTTAVAVSTAAAPVDHQSNPDYAAVYDVAVARGADDQVAFHIASFVVTDESVDDFLRGVHMNVLYGEHDCAFRSDACPLAPEREDRGTSGDGSSSSRSLSSSRSASTKSSPAGTRPSQTAEFTLPDSLGCSYVPEYSLGRHSVDDKPTMSADEYRSELEDKHISIWCWHQHDDGTYHRHT